MSSREGRRYRTLAAVEPVPLHAPGVVNALRRITTGDPSCMSELEKSMATSAREGQPLLSP